MNSAAQQQLDFDDTEWSSDSDSEYFVQPVSTPLVNFRALVNQPMALAFDPELDELDPEEPGPEAAPEAAPEAGPAAGPEPLDLYEQVLEAVDAPDHTPQAEPGNAGGVHLPAVAVESDESDFGTSDQEYEQEASLDVEDAQSEASSSSEDTPGPVPQAEATAAVVIDWGTSDEEDDYSPRGRQRPAEHVSGRVKRSRSGWYL